MAGPWPPRGSLGRTPLMVAAAANLDDLRAPPPGVPEGR